jgi:hypothetical protein
MTEASDQNALQAEKRRADRWVIATFVVSLVMIPLTVYGFWDARENRQRIVESEEKITEAIAGKKQAEQQTTEAREQLQKAREEKEKLQRVSIDRLLDAYNAHLKAIQTALAEYDAANRLPASAEGAASKRAAAEQHLFDEVSSFVKFVEKWRQFWETLGKILDGDVTRMDQARERGSPEDLKEPLDVLRRSFPDLRQRLGVELGEIASSAIATEIRRGG